MATKSSSETVKEVYARYGLAMYQANVLADGLTNLLALLRRASSDRLAIEDLDAFFDTQYAAPLGWLCKRLRTVMGDHYPAEWESLLKEALDKRNYIAHHFFRVNAARFVFEEGCREMLSDLHDCTETFKAADTKLERVTLRTLKRGGITEDVLGKFQEELVNTERRLLRERAAGRGDAAPCAAASQPVQSADSPPRSLTHGNYARLAAAGRQFVLPENLDDLEPPGILRSLGIDPSILSGSEECALGDIAEHTASDSGLAENETIFRWRLLALTSVQDAFVTPVYKRMAVGHWDVEYALLRFYYLGRHALGESLLATLNGLHVSARLQLAVFVELSSLQNYYLRVCDTDDSYDALDRFLAEGNPPLHTDVVKNCLPDTPLAMRVRSRLEEVLTGLRFSPAMDGLCGDPAHHSNVEDVWQVASDTVDVVLRMYYINLPMLFHPVNVLCKFGFSEPVGVYVDTDVGYIVRKTLSADDYAAFRDSGAAGGDPSPALEQFGTLPDLSESEILASFTKDPGDPAVTTIREAKMLHLLRLRAIREAMALEPLESLRMRVGMQ